MEIWMSENELKKLIKQYKIKATLILMVTLIIAVLVNTYLIKSSIDRHYDLGLPYTTSDTGFIWGAIILGLYTVLSLCFYFFERILIEVIKQQKTDS
jgi:hypothetical protein